MYKQALPFIKYLIFLFAISKTFSAEVINHDVWILFQDKVRVDSIINGNLYVFGSNVLLEGRVTKNVYVLGGNIEMDGHVDGNVRCIGGSVHVNGVIQGSLLAFAAALESAEDCIISKQLTCFTGSSYIQGLIGGKTTIYSPSVKLNGIFQSNVNVHADRFIISRNTKIKGMVHYWDSSKIENHSSFLKDKIRYHQSFFSQFEEKWLRTLAISASIVAMIMNFMYTFVITLILMKYYPRTIQKGTMAISNHPVKSLINGIVIALAMPLLAFLLLVSIIGAPFALTLLALNIIGYYTAKIFFLFWIAHKVKFLSKYPKAKFSCLLALYFLFLFIPYVGILLSIVATLYGLGSLITMEKRA